MFHNMVTQCTSKTTIVRYCVNIMLQYACSIITTMNLRFLD
jgi:hypothetical protein